MASRRERGHLIIVFALLSVCVVFVCDCTVSVLYLQTKGEDPALSVSLARVSRTHFQSKRKSAAEEIFARLAVVQPGLQRAVQLRLVLVRGVFALFGRKAFGRLARGDEILPRRGGEGWVVHRRRELGGAVFAKDAE